MDFSEIQKSKFAKVFENKLTREIENNQIPRYNRYSGKMSISDFLSNYEFENTVFEIVAETLSEILRIDLDTAYDYVADVGIYGVFTDMEYVENIMGIAERLYTVSKI